MRFIVFLVALGVLALCGANVAAQINLLNTASGGPPTATTTGTLHSIDTANVKVGVGSVARAPGPANSSYLPTAAALDPTTNGNCAGANKGLTIQFWYRPGNASLFSYLFGDALWVGSAGAFRCFQNGAAGIGNLLLRGPLTQRVTAGSPLTSVPPGTWIHFAVVVDTTANSITWYVNGTQNSTGAANITGKGTNFTCLGYNGSSSAGASGNFDDFRIYDWARSAADIKADYTTAASGKGPSGCPNQPDLGYYECESALNPHIAAIGRGREPLAGFTRLFTAGDTITWNCSSPAAGPFSGTCIMNIFFGGTGSPRRDAYLSPQPVPSPPGPFVTPLVPGLQLGHCLSVPQSFAIIWPDGLGIGRVLGPPCGGVAIPGGYSYGKGPGPTMSFQMPFLGLQDGDRIDMQWLSLDLSFPTGVAFTNRTSFMKVSEVATGPHAHVEARGVNVIQNTGFWEVWNTGTVPIKEVCIDLAGTSASWVPTGNLNSGGTLAAGTSFRFQTDAICDLTPLANPRYKLTGANLCFSFTCPPAPGDGFEGPTNHFVFDCDVSPRRNGGGYAGATVKVTFCDNTVLNGTLKVDPKDPQAAIVDL